MAALVSTGGGACVEGRSLWAPWALHLLGEGCPSLKAQAAVPLPPGFQEGCIQTWRWLPGAAQPRRFMRQTRREGPTERPDTGFSGPVDHTRSHPGCLRRDGEVAPWCCTGRRRLVCLLHLHFVPQRI